MENLVDTTRPATYKMYATLFTEVLDDEKWYQVQGLSRCFRSDTDYPTAEAAVTDRAALDITTLATRIEEVLASAIDKAGGYPRIRVTLELFPVKCAPRASSGTPKKESEAAHV